MADLSQDTLSPPTPPASHEPLIDASDEQAFMVRYLAERDVPCPNCGYNLRQLTRSICPECGEPLTLQVGMVDPKQASFLATLLVRELEQCIRNVLIRREYHPTDAAPTGASQQIADDVIAGRLTADELLSRYCTIVYAQEGSYEAAARRLGLDRRTVKAKLDEALLERLKG